MHGARESACMCVDFRPQKKMLIEQVVVRHIKHPVLYVAAMACSGHKNNEH